MDIIYLAIPYSYNPEQSYQIVCEVTAELIKQGKVVYSPITQGHAISKYLPMEKQKDSEFWLDQTLPIMKICTELKIVEIGDDGKKLIEESIGCQTEINKAYDHDIKITYFKYNL